MEKEEGYGIGTFEVIDNLATVGFDGIPNIDRPICVPALLGLNFYYMYYCRFHESLDVYNRFIELMEQRIEKVSLLRPVISV